MCRSLRVVSLAFVAAAALSLLPVEGLAPSQTALAAPAAEPPPAPPTSQPTTHTVQPADLVLSVRRDGRIDSARRAKIRFAPDGFSGSLKVLEVMKRGGPVARGDVLLRLDGAELDKALRAAREALSDGQRNLDLARQERRVTLSANSVALERAETAHRNALHASQIWEKAEGANMLKSAELSVLNYEYSLDDQKEELNQLELMYQGTELAGETKEIVLERARRGVRMTQQHLGIARDNLAVTREFRHPDRQLDIALQLRWTAADLDHARTNTRLSDIRSAAAIESGERAVRDNTEHLGKLERDEASPEISAPADGVITAIDLQPGDSVAANAVICELLDPRDLVVKFNATEEDLRLLAVGEAVKLTFPAFGELVLHGTVTELALIGNHADAGSTFPCVVRVEGTHDLLRIGERCRVNAQSTMHGVLAVPRKAIESREGKTYCKVWRDAAPQEIEVVLGAGNETMVQIASGLTAGEQVIVPVGEEKEKQAK